MRAKRRRKRFVVIHDDIRYDGVRPLFLLFHHVVDFVPLSRSRGNGAAAEIDNAREENKKQHKHKNEDRHHTAHTRTAHSIYDIYIVSIPYIKRANNCRALIIIIIDFP